VSFNGASWDKGAAVQRGFGDGEWSFGSGIEDLRYDGPHFVFFIFD